MKIYIKKILCALRFIIDESVQESKLQRVVQALVYTNKCHGSYVGVTCENVDVVMPIVWSHMVSQSLKVTLKIDAYGSSTFLI